MANAFTAGVEPGGLRSMEEIKTLICYLLHTVREPIPKQMLSDIIAGNGMANFFDTAAAMDDLLQREHITENEEGLLTVTETGRQIADILSSSLPFTSRERSVETALQLLSRMHKQENTTVEMEETENGYIVTMSILDKNTPILRVSVLAADSMQATAIKNNFLQDPALLYRSTIAVLNGQTKEDHTGLHVLI